MTRRRRRRGAARRGLKPREWPVADMSVHKESGVGIFRDSYTHDGLWGDLRRALVEQVVDSRRRFGHTAQSQRRRSSGYRESRRHG